MDFNLKKFVLDFSVSLIFLFIIFFGISAWGFYGQNSYGHNDFVGNITTFNARFFDFPVAVIKNYQNQGILGLNLVNLSEYETNLQGLKHFYNFAYQVDLNDPSQLMALREIRKLNLDKVVEMRLIREALAREGSFMPAREVEARWQEVSQGLNEVETRQNIKDIYGWDLEQFRELVFLPQLEAEAWQNFLFKDQNFENKTKQKADVVWQELMDGLDFAEAAKAYSDDSSATLGGVLGFTGRGVWVKEFEDIAFALKVGEISSPIKTQFGYHIIKSNGQRLNPSTLQPEVNVSHILLAFPTPADILLDWLEQEKAKLEIVRLAKGV